MKVQIWSASKIIMKEIFGVLSVKDVGLDMLGKVVNGKQMIVRPPAQTMLFLEVATGGMEVENVRE